MRFVKLGLLTVVGLFVCAVPSASTHAGQPSPPCTSATSSVRMRERPVTIWHPPGCSCVTEPTGSMSALELPRGTDASRRVQGECGAGEHLPVPIGAPTLSPSAIRLTGHLGRYGSSTDDHSTKSSIESAE
jgi:hypothetical protein